MSALAGRKPPIERVLGALPGDWRVTRDPDEWVAQCPVHADSHPSLVIRRNAEGQVWLKCWAGCEKERILEALGLEWRDLWEDSEDDHQAFNWRYRNRGLPRHLRRAMKRLLARDDALTS